MISTQAARLQDEEDSQFEVINKLEREAGKHRERAEAAKKEASRIDGETGSAEAEKRRGEAEVSDLRDALADAKGDLDDTSDAYARLSQALSSSEPLDRDVAALVQKTLDAKGQELAEAEAETEKEADEALRREESVVAEKRNAVEGAADEVAALAPKVPRRRPYFASTAWGVTRRRRHAIAATPRPETAFATLPLRRSPRPSASNARPTTSCGSCGTPPTRP